MQALVLNLVPPLQQCQPIPPLELQAFYSLAKHLLEQQRRLSLYLVEVLPPRWPWTRRGVLQRPTSRIMQGFCNMQLLQRGGCKFQRSLWRPVHWTETGQAWLHEQTWIGATHVWTENLITCMAALHLLFEEASAIRYDAKEAKQHVYLGIVHLALVQSK